MTQSTKNPGDAVAASQTPPYTQLMVSERAGGTTLWWQEILRLAPVLTLGALLLFQMMGLQRQIGDMRVELREEVGALQEDLRKEMREEIGVLREEMRREIGALTEAVTDLGDRMTRMETVLRIPTQPVPEDPRERNGHSQTN